MSEADSKVPATAEAILALPQLGFSRLQLVSDEKCECRYRDRVILTSKPHERIFVPVAPRLMAHYVGPDDIMFVVDKAGDSWAPVLTEDGWCRQEMRF